MIYPFLLDENLPRKLLAILEGSFPGSTHISLLHLLSNTDMDIWKYAKTNNYCIVSKDWDFYNMSILYGCPPKVIRLNCGSKSTGELERILEERLDIIHEFQEDDANCYLEIE